MIKSVIIDDEPLAIDIIRNYIEKVSFLTLQQSFVNSVNASLYLNEHPVDLIFLDINMPDLNGVDLVKSLSNSPNIIFTTAYANYAVEGFELDAVDYLLKPISFSRFLKACNKVKKMYESDPLSLTEITEIEQAPSHDFIFLKVEHNNVRINISEITLIEGYKDYCKVYLNAKERPVLTLKSIKAFEELLPQHLFIRVHKSFLINIQFIESYRNGRIILKQKSVPIGDQYKEVFNAKVLNGRF